LSKCLFVGCCSTPTLSDVGLDAAMEQLDDLEGKLGFLHSSQESLPVILTEDIFLGKVFSKLSIF